MSTQYPPQPYGPPLLPPTAPPVIVAPKKAVFTAALLGLAAGAAIVGGAWALTASNGPAVPGTFTLKGTFTLTEDAVERGDGCSGRYDSGYDDIAEGTSVTVYGAKGDVIATGNLGNSKSITYGTCTYKVAVDGVPKGEKFYKVEVSHRGTLQLSAKEAENGGFAGTLG
ncbi:hypothetical protein ACWCRC_38880 [Streptomyces sp. NPDC001940]